MRRVIDRWQEQALAACGHKTVDDIWEGYSKNIPNERIYSRVSITEFIVYHKTSEDRFRAKAQNLYKQATSKQHESKLIKMTRPHIYNAI